VSEFGFYRDNVASVTFETHLEGLDYIMKDLLLELRNFTKSLGSNVIEEIRPHRIVYAKTLTFRTFLDVQPRVDHLILSTKEGRIEPEKTFTIYTKQDLENAMIKIAQAYKTVK
jgi:hypothetical protein